MKPLPASPQSGRLMWTAFAMLGLGTILSLFRDEWLPFVVSLVLFLILAVTEAVLRERQAAVKRDQQKDPWDRRGDSRYYKENP